MIASCDNNDDTPDVEDTPDVPGNNPEESLDLAKQWGARVNEFSYVRVSEINTNRGRITDNSLNVEINGLTVSLPSSGEFTCLSSGDNGWFGFNGFINVPNSLREVDFTREKEQEIDSISIDENGVKDTTTIIINVLVTSPLDSIFAKTGLSIGDFEIDDPDVRDNNDIIVGGQISLNVETFSIVVSIHTPNGLTPKDGYTLVEHQYSIPDLFDASESISFSDGAYSVDFTGILQEFTYDVDRTFMFLENTKLGSVNSSGRCGR